MMRSKFYEDLYKPEEADVIVFGIPLGDGSLQALQSLRHHSWDTESYDIERGFDVIGELKIADMGDYRAIGPLDITRSTKKVLEWGKFPLILGGQHTLTLFAIDAFPPDVKVIDFDAHTDIRNVDCDNGQKVTRMTWVRRFCEKRGPQNIAIVGVRSGDEEGTNYMKNNNMLYFTARDVKDRFRNVKEQLENFAAGSSVYITLDIDVFDPAIAPGVDYPETGGIFFTQFAGLIENIRNIIGMDLVEVKKMQDSHATEFLATKCVLEVLSKLKK